MHVERLGGPCVFRISDVVSSDLTCRSMVTERTSLTYEPRVYTLSLLLHKTSSRLSEVARGFFKVVCLNASPGPTKGRTLNSSRLFPGNKKFYVESNLIRQEWCMAFVRPLCGWPAVFHKVPVRVARLAKE